MTTWVFSQTVLMCTHKVCRHVWKINVHGSCKCLRGEGNSTEVMDPKGSGSGEGGGDLRLYSLAMNPRKKGSSKFSVLDSAAFVCVRIKLNIARWYVSEVRILMRGGGWTRHKEVLDLINLMA